MQGAPTDGPALRAGLKIGRNHRRRRERSVAIEGPSPWRTGVPGLPFRYAPASSAIPADPGSWLRHSDRRRRRRPRSANPLKPIGSIAHCGIFGTATGIDVRLPVTDRGSAAGTRIRVLVRIYLQSRMSKRQQQGALRRKHRLVSERFYLPNMQQTRRISQCFLRNLQSRSSQRETDRPQRS